MSTATSEAKCMLGVASDDDTNEMTLSNWRKVWEIGKTIWHIPFYNPQLVRFLDRVINGRPGLKMFFPLCGKAVDMKWMYDEGHLVVGVDAAPVACEQFFLENKLPYDAEELEMLDGKLYKSKDGTIKIYCCDFLQFHPSIEKDFDVIFDRGGLTCIKGSKRPRYAKNIVAMMKPECRYLLLTFDFDETKHTGPPFYVSLDEIDALYGSKCNMDLLLDEEYNVKPKEWTPGKVNERVHLIVHK